MGTIRPPRPAYPPEFRARAVELARASGLAPSQVARDLGIDPDTLRRWLRQADVDAGRSQGTTTDEKAELARLRREVAVLAAYSIRGEMLALPSLGCQKNTPDGVSGQHSWPTAPCSSACAPPTTRAAIAAPMSSCA